MKSHIQVEVVVLVDINLAQIKIINKAIAICIKRQLIKHDKV